MAGAGVGRLGGGAAQGLSAGEHAEWHATGQANVLRFARAGGRLALGSDYGGGLVRDAEIPPGMPWPTCNCCSGPA